MAKSKSFRMGDAILTVICVVFVAEAAAPVAALGNSQYFWWLFMIVCFLLPYGLISSELGTAYSGEGGLYDWVRAAYPTGRTAGRVAWYYWINFPLWMASLAVICPSLIGIITGWEAGLWPTLIIELAFIWVIVWISFYPVCDSSWILNGSAVIKLLLALIMGGLGIYGAVTRGTANPMTFQSFLPSFDLDSLSFISVIIFNCLGFEVICTFADDMPDPNRQIPRAIIIGGLVIASIYVFCAFGIGVAIPAAEISSDTGLLDAMTLLTGGSAGLFIKLMALLFFVTLFGNMISWSLGVNSVAAYAAERGDLPAVYSRRGKNDMPTGPALMNGIVASVVVIIGAFLPDPDLFWSFFALNLVMFLLSYLPVFPAFLKLRRDDPDRPRPFRVPGGPWLQKVLAIVPIVLIAAAILLTAVPLGFDADTLSAVLPITVGSVVFIIIGEIMLAVLHRKEG